MKWAMNREEIITNRVRRIRDGSSHDFQSKWKKNETTIDADWYDSYTSPRDRVDSRHDSRHTSSRRNRYVGMEDQEIEWANGRKSQYRYSDGDSSNSDSDSGGRRRSHGRK
jgi:hypothetical protein